MQEEEERALYGFSDEDIQKRAKAKNISYTEAFEQLSEEIAEKEQQEKAKEEQRRLEKFYEEFDRVLAEEESQA